MSKERVSAADDKEEEEYKLEAGKVETGDDEEEEPEASKIDVDKNNQDEFADKE